MDTSALVKMVLSLVQTNPAAALALVKGFVDMLTPETFQALVETLTKGKA